MARKATCSKGETRIRRVKCLVKHTKLCVLNQKNVDNHVREALQVFRTHRPYS